MPNQHRQETGVTTTDLSTTGQLFEILSAIDRRSPGDAAPRGAARQRDRAGTAVGRAATGRSPRGKRSVRGVQGPGRRGVREEPVEVVAARNGLVPTRGALALQHEARAPRGRAHLRLLAGQAGAPTGGRDGVEVLRGRAGGSTAGETAPPSWVAPGGQPRVDARAWASRLVQAVAEVVAGDRPISQLVRWTDAVVFAELNRRVRLLGLTTTAGYRGAHERSAVWSVRVTHPAARVAEVAAHVRCGNRSRAMALRLEVRRGRWVCTALELG